MGFFTRTGTIFLEVFIHDFKLTTNFNSINLSNFGNLFLTLIIDILVGGSRSSLSIYPGSHISDHHISHDWILWISI